MEFISRRFNLSRNEANNIRFCSSVALQLGRKIIRFMVHTGMIGLIGCVALHYHLGNNTWTCEQPVNLAMRAATR